MKPILFRIVLFFFCLNCFSNSNAQTTCYKFGGNHFDYAFDMLKDNSGNFLLTGRSFSWPLDPNDPWPDAYIVKLDPQKNVLWSTLVRTSYEDHANSIVQAPDGGYLVAGAHYGTNNNGSYDTYLMKLNSAGNLQWGKTIGDGVNQEAYIMIRGANNSLYIGGYSDSVYAGNNQSFTPMLMKTDTAGNVLWAKIFGLTNSINAGAVYDIMELTDGTVLVTGSVARNDVWPSNDNLMLARFSSNGNLMWFKHTGKSCTGCFDMGAKILKMPDNTFLSVGTTSSFGTGTYLINFDINGNFISRKIIPGDFSFPMNIDAINTSDGGIMIATGQAGYMAAIKLTAANTIEWTQTYGDTLAGYAATILENDPNEFLLFGQSPNDSSSYDDYMLVELDSMGNSCCKQWTYNLTMNNTGGFDSSDAFCNNLSYGKINNGIGLSVTGAAVLCGVQSPPNYTGSIVKENEIEIYPNPTTGIIYIAGEIDFKKTEITLTDVSGKIVKKHMIQSSGKKYALDLSSFPPGIYHLSLQTDSQLLTKKIILTAY
jgi:hypothetical protein